MHRRLQFGMRENPASDRRHGSRLAEPREWLPSSANEEDKVHDSAVTRGHRVSVPSKNAAQHVATVGEKSALAIEERERESHPSDLLCRQAFDPIEPVWNCIEAARFLRSHPKTVKRLAQLGQIPGCRLGRGWFFRPSDLDAILRSGVSSSEKATRVAPQLSS